MPERDIIAIEGKLDVILEKMEHLMKTSKCHDLRDECKEQIKKNEQQCKTNYQSLKDWCIKELQLLKDMIMKPTYMIMGVGFLFGAAGTVFGIILSFSKIKGLF